MTGCAVAITGIGLLTPLGAAADDLWASLITGKTAARPWEDLRQEGFRITQACRIDGFDAPSVTRAASMAAWTARRAISDASGLPSGRLGILLGSTMGETGAYEAAALGPDPLPAVDASVHALGEAVAAAIGRPAVLRCYSTACAAGNFAISAGVTLLRRGRIDVAVAGGVDAFSRIALAGFSRSRAMTPDLCRPFDAGRRGMQLGEAAAFLILEREDDARRRGATVIARVHEAGLSCDAYHSTAPEPSGAGMVTAMREALAYANIQPDAVAFVCAHGSGTRASDSAEALAIARVFGPGARVFGIKGALGHSMGAASAVEAAVTALALRDSRIPPTTNSVELEKGLDIDLVTEPRSAPGARYALSNAFGFGGINSALLLEAV